MAGFREHDYEPSGSLLGREFHDKVYYFLALYEWLCCITVTADVARGGVGVKALRYKPAGRGFDSRWCHWNFSVT